MWEEIKSKKCYSWKGNNGIIVNIADAIALVVRIVILIILNRKLLNIILKVNGFRKIEWLIGISHVSVINWIRQFASKFKNIPKKYEKVDIIELDEMCVSSKKNMVLYHCKHKN